MIIESQSSNAYYLNPNKKYFSIIHPLFKDFIKHNFDTEKLLAKGYSMDEILYYKSKYDFLKLNKIVEPINIKKFNHKITEDDVRFSLQNCTDIIFEVTTSCNISCDYCFYGDLYEHEKPKKQNLSVSKAILLLDYIINLKSMNSSSYNEKITIHFYGGEPLLNMQFIKEVINHVKRLKSNFAFKYGITTNATLLDKHIDFLVENKIDLLISLDGDYENNLYRKFRNGKTTFDLVLKSNLLIKEKYPEYFKKHVNFNAVLHKHNSLEEIHDFFRITFDKVPLTANLNANGIKPERKEQFLSTYKSISKSYNEIGNNKLKEELYQYDPKFTLTADFIEKYSPSIYSNAIELISSRKNSRQYPTGTCMPFSRSIFLNANGNIMPCTQISPLDSLGNVTEQSVDINLKEISNLYNSFFEKINNQCQSCFNNEYCNKCIFNIPKIEGEPKCSDFQDKNSFRKMVSQITSVNETLKEISN